MKKFLTSMTIAVCAAGSVNAQTPDNSAPPPLIPFSGVMSSPGGGPFTGLTSAIFSLYEEPEGGVPVWVDIQLVQTDGSGEYLALLGGSTELPVDLFATSQALWLGVQPEGQAEQDRVQFISVPYALKARDADTLGGRPLADFALLGEENGGGGGSVKADGALTGDSMSPSVDTKDINEPGNLTVNGTAGIGTVSPDSRLHVHAASAGSVSAAFGTVVTVENSTTSAISILSPSASARAIYFGDPALNVNGGIVYNDEVANGFGFRVNGNATKLAIAPSGNIGIGTTSPGRAMEVHGGSGEAFLALTNDGTAGEHAILFGDDLSDIKGRLGYDTNTNQLKLYANSSVGMVIDSSGNVGIGTLSPSAKLQVAGDVVVDGNIAAKYQDVAEWVQAVGAPTAGTVMVADTMGRNRVRTSDGPYDTKVLGAISLQPGLVLGEPGPGRVLVAQSGRVKVKVDASYGAIATGDLLSTSPTQGHAMRSDPLTFEQLSLHRPGTILGKALEPMPKGRGEILVLLTLQ